MAQYLDRAKTYLERIKHMSKSSNMNGGGLNHLPLVQGIKDSYIKQRVAKEVEYWRTMEEAFNSISKHAGTAERGKLTTGHGMMTSHLSMQYIVNIWQIMNINATIKAKTSHII